MAEGRNYFLMVLGIILILLFFNYFTPVYDAAGLTGFMKRDLRKDRQQHDLRRSLRRRRKGMLRSSGR